MTTDPSTGQVDWQEETSRLFMDYGRYFVPERDHQIRLMVDFLAGLGE